MRSLKKKELFWPFLVVGVGAVLVFLLIELPLLNKPMMAEGNAYSRLQTIVMEINSPNYLTDFSWLPFYNKIMSWPMGVYSEPTAQSVRIFSLIITLLSSGCVYALTYELTKLKSLSIIALSFFLINPLTLSLSTLILSENLWIFMLLLSLVFLVQKNKKYWVMGIVAWFVSQGIRYESWYLTPVLMFIIWTRHRNLKLLISFFIASLLFPLYWIIESYRYTGTYLNILNIKKHYAANGPQNIYGHLNESIRVWLEKIELVISWPFVLIYLLGIYEFVRQKNWLWLIPTVSVFLLIIQVFLGTMEYFPARYLVVLPATIYPLIFVFIKKHYENNILLGTGIIVFLFIFELVNIIPRMRLIDVVPDKDTLAVANYIEQNFDRNSKVRYLEEDSRDTTWTFSTIWYFSKVPLSSFIYAKKNNDVNFVGDEEMVTIMEKGIDKKVDKLYKKIMYENDYYIVFGRE
ncbi:MAG TPA: hypothetical protein VN174_01655 [Candidatus Methanoperedens sp.]|nr:hypothetical protein [Candidatus Methanoperedens sp.]